MRTMAAGEFKAKCLAVMAEVNATGTPVLITKRGKPLARLVPLQSEGSPRAEVSQVPTIESLFGSLQGMITLNCDPEELINPMIDANEWDHLKPDWSPDTSV